MDAELEDAADVAQAEADNAKIDYDTMARGAQLSLFEKQESLWKNC